MNIIKMAIKKKDILDKLAEEVDKIKEEVVSVVAPKKAKKATPMGGQAAVKEIEEKDLSPMAVLLEENPVKIPQVGDVIEGIVIDITSNSLLLDLGALGTGIVLGKEIKDGLAIGKVKKGDKVGAALVDMENEDGYIELSIREASYERAWDDLETKRDQMGVVTTKVLDANKGGLMVEVNGITGFIPVSQLSSEHYPRVEDGDKNKILELLKKLVGKEMLVRILDADRESEKLIVSERAASSEKEKEVIAKLQAGDVIEGEISGVVDFGAFVKFLPPAKMASDRESDKLEGLVHISELAWQLIDDPRTVVKTGDKVKAKIIGIDDTRISLSMKALAKDPWSEIAEKYKVGDTVQGKIDKINPFGAFVYLDKDIHGLAHVSEFQEVYPGKKMDEILHAGETYAWKILSIEPRSHRMGLMIVKEEK
ncbi:MAG: S1 RNA-binding domain-containing protein [Candidatus Moranbacteria bacterium]|nr:S1 RNA-binding domain-containing protein [Candidatus Moranbacteria bacterium]